MGPIRPPAGLALNIQNTAPVNTPRPSPPRMARGARPRPTGATLGESKIVHPTGPGRGEAAASGRSDAGPGLTAGSNETGGWSPNAPNGRGEAGNSAGP